MSIVCVCCLCISENIRVLRETAFRAIWYDSSIPPLVITAVNSSHLSGELEGGYLSMRAWIARAPRCKLTLPILQRKHLPPWCAKFTFLPEEWRRRKWKWKTAVWQFIPLCFCFPAVHSRCSFLLIILFLSKWPVYRAVVGDMCGLGEELIYVFSNCL